MSQIDLSNPQSLGPANAEDGNDQTATYPLAPTGTHPLVEQTDFAKYKSNTFFGSLDGVRALSVLAVVWHHTAEPIAALPMTGRGFVGVDMFFVLSGFLIVTLLLREKQRNGNISLGRFYMRRSLRIFPLYYGLLFGLTLLFGVIVTGTSLSAPFLDRLPYYLTYTANWVPAAGGLMAIAWSLAAEEQFYLFWPPLEKLFRRQIILYPLIFLLIFLNQLVNFGYMTPFLSRFGFEYGELEMLQVTFTPILLGVLLAHLLHRPTSFRAVARTIGHPWMGPVWLGALLVVLNIPNTDIGGIQRLTIHLLMTYLLAAIVCREAHPLQSYLSWKWLVRIGMISYGIYLLHMPVRLIGFELVDRFRLEPVPGALFIITLIGTLVAAELSFRYFETPFLRLKERWKPAAE